VTHSRERLIERLQAAVRAQRGHRQLHEDDTRAVDVEPVRLVARPRRGAQRERHGRRRSRQVRRFVDGHQKLLRRRIPAAREALSVSKHARSGKLQAAKGAGTRARALRVQDGFVGRVVLAGAQVRAGAQVDELEDAQALVQHQVERLDVTVHEAGGVQLAQRLQQLRHDGLRHRQLRVLVRVQLLGHGVQRRAQRARVRG
jgi:hypothetical protein